MEQQLSIDKAVQRPAIGVGVKTRINKTLQDSLKTIHQAVKGPESINVLRKHRTLKRNEVSILPENNVNVFFFLKWGGSARCPSMDACLH
jgi:hypothetical protein